jgi:predicted regulator of Ras-like GTPase activity (Roadblock/LC7/MglB family)
MFREVLQNVVDSTEGGIASVLMGFDGILVEQYVKDGETLEIEPVGMEYSVVLKQIRTASEMLAIGGPREVSIRAENLTTVVRLLNDEYFVAVTLAPHGNAGKARYLLRVSAGDLLKVLE